MGQLGALIFLMALGPLAGADQCVYVTRAEASWAQRHLKSLKQVVHFCQPCGDLKPSAPVPVVDLEIQGVSGGNFQVMVNHQGLDLAYTYVKTGDSRYTNLAQLVGCQAVDVWPFVEIEKK